MVRALDSRPKGRGFESGRQDHKNNFAFFPNQKGCADALSVCPSPRENTHAYERPRTHVSPCQSSVDYGNTTITSMHLYPRKIECGCPSGGGIKKRSHIYTGTLPLLWRNAERREKSLASHTIQRNTKHNAVTTIITALMKQV